MKIFDKKEQRVKVKIGSIIIARLENQSNCGPVRFLIEPNSPQFKFQNKQTNEESVKRKKLWYFIVFVLKKMCK